MTPRSPTVTCLTCHFAWHSITMAEGLRLLGSCPRCSGPLEFASPASSATPVAQAGSDLTVADSRPPHLVLGMPRR
jgi:hypothetical protein